MRMSLLDSAMLVGMILSNDGWFVSSKNSRLARGMRRLR